MLRKCIVSVLTIETSGCCVDALTLSRHLIRIGIKSSIFTSERVHRAPNASWLAVEHMGVNHGRAYVFVPEKLLNGSDVVACFKQVGGKRTSECVAGRPLVLCFSMSISEICLFSGYTPNRMHHLRANR